MATDYKKKAQEARLKVLEMVYKAGTSHIASNFSVIDIATVLYNNLKEGDEVVWSTGWKAATIYYFLAQQGKIPKEDLELFGKEIIGNCPFCEGDLAAHDCPQCDGIGEIKKIKYLGLAETNIPGVLCNGGAMGHGLPIACGIAFAQKLKGEEGKVYCIMSDGEMNEGTTWESALFAGHHHLDNLVVIVDVNKWQAMGKTEDVLKIEEPSRVFHGFRWRFHEMDGHDHEKLGREFEGLMHYFNEYKCPTVVWAHTIKGKGVSFMEDHLLYHYKHVDEENYKMAKTELEKV